MTPQPPPHSLPRSLDGDPEVTPELAREHGLTDDEYAVIQGVLGRTPTYTELGVYSVMWSEHCSYKNSIALLKTLPRDGDKLLAAAGDENAGLVDIGGGLACAFKIESHNHPSAVEPVQGAATGVGGIQRDIFTMGARPIASLNSLRFGSLDNPRVRFLFDGVVRGIGGYGNSFGVPTVGGEVVFDPAYEGNPLVNAMSVGIVKVGETVSATAQGVGNPVYIVGSATGRDGIHGATFASVEISEDSEANRPNVQVGDPFTEKLLLEATLEAIRTGAVVGMQDMGAAGISCSSSEMSEKGGVGMDIQLDKTPQRETGMTPYELLLSESQERMLVVVEKGREHEIEAVFDKWDLHAVQIGVVTDSEHVRVYWHGDLVMDIPAESLVLGGGAPVYYRETSRPTYLDDTLGADLDAIPDVTADTAGEALVALMGAPNIASKRWVFEQYDTEVRTNTVAGPGPTDAAVVRLKGTATRAPEPIPARPAGVKGPVSPGTGERGLAMATDCNGRYVYLNPRRGAQIAVAEAARNVVCAGGEPLGVTNCLNFGNPYKPEVYWQFTEAVGGMGDACRAFGTPVTGGNVSFYNENPDGAIFPTPTIGMVGLVEDVDRDATTAAFRAPGDAILLVSPAGWWHTGGIEASEYLHTRHDRTAGDAPHLDLEEEKTVHATVLAAIRAGLVKSAHDCADGGLAVALAESCLHGGFGASVSLPATDARLDAVLFGEAQSRVVLSVAHERTAEVEALAARHGARVTTLGTVGLDRLAIAVGGTTVVDEAVVDLKQPYDSAIPDAMGEPVAAL
ncbi:phosphoribosylformylglycinamidine synthase subunit PurL [Rubrivirga sp. IMCC45206]|uniref:phosphoribosylformylglycinamidine synthase subunit PurL n=1 Tax=Rubrivirga sp. IMCC45206 TaxID=3391614 RepID=UPI00398FEF5D